MANSIPNSACSILCPHQETQNLLTTSLLDHYAKLTNLESQLRVTEDKLANTEQTVNNLHQSSSEVNTLRQDLQKANAKTKRQRGEITRLHHIIEELKTKNSPFNAGHSKRGLGPGGNPHMKAIQTQLKLQTDQIERLLGEADHNYHRAQNYKACNEALEKRVQEYEDIFRTYNNGLHIAKDIVKVVMRECMGTNEPEVRIASITALVERLEKVMGSAPSLEHVGARDSFQSPKASTARSLQKKREGLRDVLEDGGILPFQTSAGPSVHPDRLRLAMEQGGIPEEELTRKIAKGRAKRTAANCIPVSSKRRLDTSLDHKMKVGPPTKLVKTVAAHEDVVSDHAIVNDRLTHLSIVDQLQVRRGSVLPTTTNAASLEAEKAADIEMGSDDLP